MKLRGLNSDLLGHPGMDSSILGRSRLDSDLLGYPGWDSTLLGWTLASWGLTWLDSGLMGFLRMDYSLVGSLGSSWVGSSFPGAPWTRFWPPSILIISQWIFASLGVLGSILASWGLLGLDSCLLGWFLASRGFR